MGHYQSQRKIKATHLERRVFGDGTGDTNESVVDTEIGRIGHLNCWENMNQLLKSYTVFLGEQVHIAAWPLYPDATTLKYPDPYTNISDANSDIVTPAYAIETATFTLAPFQIISAEGIKLNTRLGRYLEDPRCTPSKGLQRTSLRRFIASIPPLPKPKSVDNSLVFLD